MADTIFLSPQLQSALTPECKALLTGLHVEIIDEELRRKAPGSLIHAARWRNWLPEPKPKIRTIAAAGADTPLHEDADYTLDLSAGEVTLAQDPGGIVRADYFYQPLNDTILERLLNVSIKEISTLVGRSIDPLDIHPGYQAVICKRLYTNVLKNLLIEARSFFSVSVAGRSISKQNIPGNIDLMIKENETQLFQEINAIRLWPRVQVLE